MKEFIEKLIGRLEEREVQAYAKTDGGATYTAYRNAIEIVNELAEEYKDKSGIIDNLKKFLKEKFNYCAEQAEMNLEAECNSEIASYFRERKELYLDRANIYGEVMREVDRLAEDSSAFPVPLERGGWIPVSERLPDCENKYGWVSCIVSVIRSHYPTSTYDICDSPYDENIVMHANYHVSQKIWHLESDEQLNALIDIEDAPLNGDYVIAWQPLPEPYKGE